MASLAPTEDQILTAFISQFTEEVPELVRIVNSARDGQITMEEALYEMARAVRQREQALVKTQTPTTPVPQDPPPAEGIDPQASILLLREGKLPQLNPLYEAALIERLQFDGDIPEARTGPMPSGHTPAVPVDTTARSSVALGMLLQSAQQKIQKALEAEEKDRKSMLVEAASAFPSTNELSLALRSQLDMVLGGSAETDPEGYRRGQPAALQKMEAPPTSALLILTEEDKKALSWKFLSTSQGRRSAVGQITDIVLKALRDNGYMVQSGKFSSTQAHVSHTWVVYLSGPGSTQSAFSFVDTAARAIALGLLRKLRAQNGKPEPHLLEICPEDAISERMVGWTGRVA